MKKQDTSGTWHNGIPPWSELGRMAQTGTIDQVLSEGDLIPIRLANGEDNAIRVTHDRKNNMFFVFENCLEENAPMNPSLKNLPGWGPSVMNGYLNRTVIKLFPSDLQAVIQPIQIEQKMEDRTYLVNSKLFLLSEEQVFGKCKYSEPEKGVSQLECFKKSIISRMKMRNEKPAWWWLRSPRASSSYGFVYVGSDGSVSRTGASIAGGVAPGFCLIEPKTI